MNKQIRVDIIDESRPDGEQVVCFFMAEDFKSYAELAEAVSKELGGYSEKARESRSFTEIVKEGVDTIMEHELLKMPKVQLQEMAKARGIKRVHDVQKKDLIKAILTVVNRRVEESNG